jgi:hypothetical protein
MVLKTIPIIRPVNVVAMMGFTEPVLETLTKITPIKNPITNIISIPIFASFRNIFYLYAENNLSALSLSPEIINSIKYRPVSRRA